MLISIHPLRGEWDSAVSQTLPTLAISIHPLRGEWDRCKDGKNKGKKISIHPLRGEWDLRCCYRFKIKAISIHPLRGEWDPWQSRKALLSLPFQSTHSVGSGTTCDWSDYGLQEISIHPLRGEWDATKRRMMRRIFYFNPPTPWGVGHFVKFSVL